VRLLEGVLVAIELMAVVLAIQQRRRRQSVARFFVGFENLAKSLQKSLPRKCSPQLTPLSLPVPRPRSLCNGLAPALRLPAYYRYHPDSLPAWCSTSPLSHHRSPSMSSCLPCADPVAPCACPAGLACIQVGRSCNQCTQNICQASTAPVASGGGGGSSPIGGTVGSALGGVLGIVAAILLVYWFWWRPRGRAASRKRYSAHITARQSKVLSLGEKRAVATALGGARTRTSVHMDVDTGVLDGIAEEDEGPASTRATAGDSQMDEVSSLGNMC
jgi:hypothetical protein